MIPMTDSHWGEEGIFNLIYYMNVVDFLFGKLVGKYSMITWILLGYGLHS